MATLYQLVDRKELHQIRIRLKRDEYEDRKIFGTGDFMLWLNGPVRSAEAFYAGDISPAHQAHAFLRQFITGQPFPDDRLFKPMRPVTDDVWEASTADLRIFGWFPEKDRFIAVCGGFFGDLKRDMALYEVNRIASITHRNSIDLDEPKYKKGGGHSDVIS